MQVDFPECGCLSTRVGERDFMKGNAVSHDFRRVHVTNVSGGQARLITQLGQPAQTHGGGVRRGEQFGTRRHLPADLGCQGDDQYRITDSGLAAVCGVEHEDNGCNVRQREYALAERAQQCVPALRWAHDSGQVILELLLKSDEVLDAPGQADFLL